VFDVEKDKGCGVAGEQRPEQGGLAGAAILPNRSHNVTSGYAECLTDLWAQLTLPWV
jgi:hypothetical protein